MANNTKTITMSMRELDRLKVIEAVVEGRLMPWRAAERLGVSRRQIERLVARYRASGPVGLVSQRRGRPSNHQLPEDLAHRALSVIRERYADFGPTLACEKLWECHGLQLSKETVRRLMTEAGLWMPRRQRPPKVYQPPARGTCPGYQSPPYPARRSNRNRSASVPRNAARSDRPAKAPTSGAKQARRPHRHPRPLLVPLRSPPPAAPDGTAALSSTNTRARVRTTRRPARSPFSRG